MSDKIYGYLSSEESMGLVDGPGIRYVLFFQGCDLRCLYCHNPETWAKKGGYKVTPDEIVSKIERFKPYFGNDGGVTFSGGEPLLQSQFLIECLKLCKAKNIHTALDTAGVGNGDYEQILGLVDLVILDVKATDGALYKKITGQSMDRFQQFVDACNRHDKKLWLRQVIVPNLNDSEGNVKSLKEFAETIKNVEKIELLPFKGGCLSKYKNLGIPFRLEGQPDMEEAKCKNLEKILS